MGDIGGLTDALMMIGKFFLSPFSSFSLKSILLTSLFKKLPIHSDKKVDDDGGSPESNGCDDSERQELNAS